MMQRPELSLFSLSIKQWNWQLYVKIYNESLNNWNFALCVYLSQNTSVTLGKFTFKKKKGLKKGNNVF